MDVSPFFRIPPDKKNYGVELLDRMRIRPGPTCKVVNFVLMLRFLHLRIGQQIYLLYQLRLDQAESRLFLCQSLSSEMIGNKNINPTPA